MAAIGTSRISLKGQAPWRGMTLTGRSDVGGFELLQDCYVNSDGTEIRMMPGMRCVIDPETQQRNANNDTVSGYRASIFDALRAPYIDFAPNTYYSVDNPSPTEGMVVWSKPGIIHCVEQVHGRWIFVGESDHRREPIYNVGNTAWVSVESYEDDGVNITITLNEAPDATLNKFNAIEDADFITFDGLTGSLASTLNGRSHLLAGPPVGSTLTLTTTSGGVVPAVTGQQGIVSRVGKNARNPTGPSDDTFSDLTIYTSIAKGDDTIAPASLVRPAHFATRMRDFGDSVASRKEGNNNAATPHGGTSRRRRIGTPYRLVPHVAGNRLIMAAPGYGCVLQAPVVIPPSFSINDTFDGIGERGNDIYDRPRSLGVPKAVVWEDPDKAVATTFHKWAVPGPSSNAFLFGGTDAASRAGTYHFKFAYADQGTGEIGLCSEPVVVSTDTSTARQGLRFWIYFPGYLMHETLATNINVYRTKKGGGTFFYDRTIPLFMASMTTTTVTKTAKYGVQPETANTNFLHHVLYEALYVDDVTLSKQLNPVPDVIEQMPMGCKAARTIRGFTFFGGALGDSGSRKEMVKGSVTLEFDPTSGSAGIYPKNDEVTLAHTASITTPIASAADGAESWLFTGARNIPPSYSGQQIVGKNIAPHPRKSLDLIKLVNTKVGFDSAAANNFLGRIADVRFQIRDTPVVADQIMQDAARRKITAYLRLPRAQIQFSEPDNPNIVPSNNRIFLANEIDDDIEGIGDAGGQAVVCTSAKTYVVAFSQSLLGAAAEVASERFGCIAANSMVSFEGGCAWISDRGPVAMIGGAVQWIGRPISPLFSGETALYKRDGDGMMRNAWACHDAERSLIYFGVYSDRNAGTPLEVTIPYGPTGVSFSWEDLRGTASQDLAWSKFPCDEVLVYSYRTDSWSVWRPPQPVQWMTRGVDAFGVNRVFLLGQDRRLYVLDDNWAQVDKDIVSFVAQASETTSSITSSLSHIASWRGLSVNVIRTDADGVKTIVGTATIQTETISGGNTTITLSQPVTTKIGDIVTIGMRSMRLRTTALNAKQSDTATTPAVGCQYALESRRDTSSGGTPPYDAFASARLIASQVENGVPVKSDQSMNGDDPSQFEWLGSHATGDPVRNQKLANGRATGQNHVLDLILTGNAQVRLQDLSIEVA